MLKVEGSNPRPSISIFKINSWLRKFANLQFKEWKRVRMILRGTRMRRITNVDFRTEVRGNWRRLPFSAERTESYYHHRQNFGITQDCPPFEGQDCQLWKNRWNFQPIKVNFKREWGNRYGGLFEPYNTVIVSWEIRKMDKKKSTY